MIAMLFAQRVILGKTAFEDLPDALKMDVADILIDAGLSALVPPDVMENMQ